jgi:hypothetical protein
MGGLRQTGDDVISIELVGSSARKYYKEHMSMNFIKLRTEIKMQKNGKSSLSAKRALRKPQITA